MISSRLPCSDASRLWRYDCLACGDDVTSSTKAHRLHRQHSSSFMERLERGGVRSVRLLRALHLGMVHTTPRGAAPNKIKPERQVCNRQPSRSSQDTPSWYVVAYAVGCEDQYVCTSATKADGQQAQTQAEQTQATSDHNKIHPCTAGFVVAWVPARFKSARRLRWAHARTNVRCFRSLLLPLHKTAKGVPSMLNTHTHTHTHTHIHIHTHGGAK